MEKLCTRNNVTEARIEKVDGNICGGAYSIGIQQNIIESLLTWYQDKGTNYTLETKVTEARIENVGGNIWRSLFYRDIENKFKSQQTWYQNKGTNFILETIVTEARVENVDRNIYGEAYSIRIQKRKLKAYRLGFKTKGYQKQMYLKQGLKMLMEIYVEEFILQGYRKEKIKAYQLGIKIKGQSIYQKQM